MHSETLVQAERLTLVVLFCGVIALAFSDFVSPAYWLLAMATIFVRWGLGPRFCLSEMLASLLGWAGFFWVGLELIFGRALIVAFTDFMLILALAVTVEAPTPRNHLHRLITGLFLVLAGSVLTDSVLYALPLAGFLLLMWRACRRLYGIGLIGGDLPLSGWRADVKAFAAMAAATLALFFLVPRTGPGIMLKNVQPKMEVSGFSNEVELADFARLLDPAVVMRVEAPGMRPERARIFLQGRYWRGVALSHFGGGRWQQVGDVLQRRWIQHQTAGLGGRRSGREIEVYREAVDHSYIMRPDGMQRLLDSPQQTGLTVNGSMKFIPAPRRRLRLRMVLNGRDGPEDLRPPLDEEKRPTGSQVISSWAKGVIGNASDPEVRIERLTETLKGWTYDLEAPIDRARPVEHFLLESRRGHCEMFASALALAARSLDIPARVVNGYYGGEWNDVGGFLLIRQQHAHAWVEAWVRGRWRRYDPTPSSRWALSGVRFVQWNHVWESVRLAWYRYVLEFQNEDRGALLKWTRRWLAAHGLWLAAALVVLSACWWLVPMLWRNKIGRAHV